MLSSERGKVEYGMKGELVMNIKNFVVHVCPEMYYPSDKPYFILGMTNLNLKQENEQLNLIIKNLLIGKDKLQANETALLCIPQIEALITTHLNNDHHTSKNNEELKSTAFSKKIEMKLNMTSFYNGNTVEHKDTDSIETIISNALSPHLHYQVSYIPLIVQTVNAFTIHPLNIKLLNWKDYELSISLAANDL